MRIVLFFGSLSARLVMETTLHRQLKLHYAGRNARFEVPVGKFRVDVVSGGRLFEIQHGTLPCASNR